MANYREDIVDIELTGGNLHRSFCNRAIGAGDEDANRFGIRLFRNGQPENVSGSVMGLFIRADGSTVPIQSGTVSGNTAYVTLPEACYAVEGNFSLAIKINGGGVTGTMRIVDGMVSRTSTDVIVDPGTILPSIDDLIEAINEAVESIPTEYLAMSKNVSEINNHTGIYVEELIDNVNYPYVDIPINAKNGDSVIVSLDYYSDNSSNLVRWYAHDPQTSQTIVTPISKTGRQKITLERDTQIIRFIFQITSIVAGIIVGFHCYKISGNAFADIAENATQAEYSITATSGQSIVQTNIPMIAEVGDLIEVEVIDDNSILKSDNWWCIVGYRSNNEQISDVLRIRAPYKAGIARINYPFDVDSLIFFVNGQYVGNSGEIKIKCKNLTKMGADIPQKRYGTFSILGDSYSTYTGYTNPAENRQWYPVTDPEAQGYESGNDVDKLSETWWFNFAHEAGIVLDKNASYSGSTICYDSYGTGSADGKTTSFIMRRGAAGTPNLLFVFGGTNDNWAGDAIGEYKYEDWTEEDLSYFAPGLAYLLYKLQNECVGTEIVFIENDILSSAYKTAIETVCNHYLVPVIKLSGIDKIHDHPSAKGMRQIANQVYQFIQNNFPMYK